MSGAPVDRLIAAREGATRRIDEFGADLVAVAEASAGSNIDDEHDPEGSTIAFEREQVAALRERARRQLDEIDAALGRLAGGSYGRCTRCGGLIAPARLEALPAAALCIACAALNRGR